MFQSFFLITIFIIVAPPLLSANSNEYMVLIPEGKFQMGTSDGDERERPVHKVQLDAFYLDRFETTNAEYEKFDPSHHRSFLSHCDDCPVTLVTWKDADSYCRSLGGRLPTEAEWEWAALKNKSETKESSVESVSTRLGQSFDEGAFRVDSPPSGKLGIFHLQGNVWEWLNDWFGPYSHLEQDNPTGPSSGVRKILRGGGWYNAEVYADPRMRFQLYPEAKISSIGFRCAKNRTDKELPNGLD